ncbi:uncharacterized protein A1O5_00719 [Cladophialophora psammophila CBS 110553]|uniref:Uncharacterized protein n=1 Tax=Cladophialophora psammophila CBS 110553 TaxID=1182543 RepID=W9XGY7_9EURO|nr:uncharacterized protein A1O5_00719 [Cladophialophora psammophila CBS 110553]EXJ76211.1 hypothetical protein A1O5_00719 [Cladophialophora psammophila CBS 110553]
MTLPESPPCSSRSGPPVSGVSSILEAPVALPKDSGSFPKDLVLVVIEKIYVRRDSFDHLDFWSESEESLRMQLDQEIDLCFRHRRGSRQPHDYLLQLTYAGTKKEELRPSIVITTSSPKTRKLIKKRLASEQVQCILQRLRRDLWVLVDSSKRAGGADTQAWPSDDLRIWLRYHVPGPSFCGSKIELVQRGAQVSACVFGGTILIGDRLFGLTASHPFPQINPDLANESKQGGSLDEDEDEAEDDTASEDEGPFYIPWNTNGNDGYEDSVDPEMAREVVLDASDEDMWISGNSPPKSSKNRGRSFQASSQSRKFPVGSCLLCDSNDIRSDV